jgi:hypothetical protein
MNERNFNEVLKGTEKIVWRSIQIGQTKCPTTDSWLKTYLKPTKLRGAICHLKYNSFILTLISL